MGDEQITRVLLVLANREAGAVLGPALQDEADTVVWVAAARYAWARLKDGEQYDVVVLDHSAAFNQPYGEIITNWLCARPKLLEVVGVIGGPNDRDFFTNLGWATASYADLVKTVLEILAERKLLAAEAAQYGRDIGPR
jgi:hypothetical protein